MFPQIVESIMPFAALHSSTLECKAQPTGLNT